MRYFASPKFSLPPKILLATPEKFRSGYVPGEKPSNSKAQAVFPLTTRYSKKKRRRQKAFTSLADVTKFFSPWFP